MGAGAHSCALTAWISPVPGIPGGAAAGMPPPTVMLLNGAADMTGSTVAVILIPPAGTIFLLAWLAVVFYAGRDHPHRPDRCLVLRLRWAAPFAQQGPRP